MAGFAALVIPNVLRKGPDPTATAEVDVMTASEHIDRGYELLDVGDYDATIVEFESAIGLGSENMEMHFDLADAYYETDQIDEVLATIERAIVIAPDEAWVQESAGWFYQSLDHHEEAISQFERTLELDPGSEWVLEGMAISYEALRNFDKADEIWGMIGSGELGEDPYALEEQGWELLSAGEYEPAEEVFSKVVELEPSLLSAWVGFTLILGDVIWRSSISKMRWKSIHQWKTLKMG